LRLFLSGKEIDIKAIGLIGGTGWISTQEYYRFINEMVNKELGGLISAKCVLYSFNYAEINALNRQGDWRGVYRMLFDAAHKLQLAGAECLVLCANTLHQFADELAGEVNIPLINIAEATALDINRRHFSRVGLLGTRITMEAEFYKTMLAGNRITSLVPEKDDREFIHETILNELLKNVISEKSKTRFLRIINDLGANGAEAIILGCTEIPLLVKPEDTQLPLVDTLQIHCQAAVAFALREG
jgi:aspartate racemase